MIKDIKHQTPKRKYPRLKDKSIYSQPGITAHIIIGTFQKQPYFNDTELAQKFLEVLVETAKENNTRIYAYCIMPDHIHILIESSKNMSIISFIKHVKGRFVSWCRENDKNIRFQRSFYDHILRKGEDVYTISRYIIGNPIRAGIEDHFGDYLFAGSLVFEF